MAVVLFLASTFAVVGLSASAVSSASPSAPAAPTLAGIVSSGVADPSALTNPATTEQASISAFALTHASGQLTALVGQLPQWYLSAVWSGLFAGNSKAIAQANEKLMGPDSHLTPALSCGTGGDLCLTGLGLLGAGLCAATAAPTLGLGCLAIGIAIVGIAAYEYWFGQSSANAIGEQVQALAEDLVSFANTDYQLEGLAIQNEVSALNLTVNALGYEAAAAALSQLGNSTFNGPLDLAQSQIATQLAGVLTAQATGIAQLVGTQEAIFSAQLGSANSEAYTCSIELGTIFNPMTGPSSYASTCPDTAPSTYYFTNGFMLGGVQYTRQTPAYLWLNNSTPIMVNSGSGNGHIEFVPVDGAWPFYNVTASASKVVTTNFTGPSGAYDALWTGSATSDFVASVSFPLSASEITTTTDYLYLNSSNTLHSVDLQSGFEIVGITCGVSTYSCGTLSGDTAGAESSNMAPNYLYALAESAEEQGLVYWTVLRDLGYTAASQIPTRCLILSPAQLLPSALTPTQMESMNATAMLRIYYALMGNLAYTFNSSSTLTAFNVCGHHVTPPSGGGPIGFGSYAYAYLYAPNSTGYVAPSGGGPAQLDVGLGGTTSSTPVSIALAVAKGQTLAIVAFSGANVPVIASDSLSQSWGQLYGKTGTGGAVGVFVVNSSSASGTDTVSITTEYGGAATFLAFNGTGASPYATIGISGWVALSSGSLLHTTVGVSSSNELTVATVLDTGSGNYSKPSSRCVSATGGSGDAVSCVEQLATGTPKVTFGVGSASYGDLVAFSVWGFGGSLVAHTGPEVYANPETWAYAGVVSLAPAIAGFSPTIGVPWLLPDNNPSFVTVEPFQFTSANNSSTGLGYVNQLGPTQCSQSNAPADNCSLATSPLSILDYVGGNSSAGEGLTGSAFPTHEDGSGTGWSIYITECFVAQAGATAQNVTYTPITTGSCGFDHDTVNSSIYVSCGGGVYVFNISSCPHGHPILVISPACGGFWLGWIAGPINSALSGLPFGLGSCEFAEGLALVILLIILVVVIAVVTRVYRAVHGRS